MGEAWDILGIRLESGIKSYPPTLCWPELSYMINLNSKKAEKCRESAQMTIPSAREFKGPFLSTSLGFFELRQLRPREHISYAQLIRDSSAHWYLPRTLLPIPIDSYSCIKAFIKCQTWLEIYFQTFLTRTPGWEGTWPPCSKTRSSGAVSLGLRAGLQEPGPVANPNYGECFLAP